ncbi:MAG: M23 family metallopeptidase [Candidatus Wildermuthbacteria bacterium]|nr:M23 family metallopeptidase [Candidatus Wildermuthbacteria bacterium]
MGIYSLYLHLLGLPVKEGQMVKRGETIAVSVNSGYSIAPHLHFSIKISKASVDPLKFFETINPFLYGTGQ